MYQVPIRDYSNMSFVNVIPGAGIYMISYWYGTAVSFKMHVHTSTDVSHPVAGMIRANYHVRATSTRPIMNHARHISGWYVGREIKQVWLRITSPQPSELRTQYLQYRPAAAVPPRSSAATYYRYCCCVARWLVRL